MKNIKKFKMTKIATVLKSLRASDKDFKLSDFGTQLSEKFKKELIATENLEKDVVSISKLQNKLYAENNQSLLIILQGMDSSGKDGTIKNTHTKNSPWYIIPSDDKSITHSLIGKIILEKLKEMKPAFPSKTKEEQQYMQAAKINLERELGRL